MINASIDERNCLLCLNNEPVNLNKKFQSEELTECVKSLPNGKAPGEDGLTFEMINASIDVLGVQLVQIFNNILDTGQFPDPRTKGMLLPLHKSGTYNDPNNFRGISLIPVLCKLFTKILNNRLI